MLHLCEVLVAIVRQVFGLAEVEERIYVASSCLETGGIFCYSPANDSVGSGAVPGRVLMNSTASVLQGARNRILKEPRKSGFY